MAIPHLVTHPVSRAQGGSAVHVAAYITRSRIVDERTGRVYDYSRKQKDVIFSGLFVPKAAPQWMHDRAMLWNGAERIDDRVNSRTGRTLEVALPHELTGQQNQWLIQDFVRENFTRKGIIADVAIHRPDAHGDERNIHAHILLSTRYVDGNGWGEKDRESNRVESLNVWRAQWQSLTNRHLARHGHEARIDMRTLDEQGIERTPEMHLGKTAAALERKGVETGRGDQLREIRAENRVRVMLHELEPVEVESAIDRQRRMEDEVRRLAQREAERDLVRGTGISIGERELLQAVRRLFVTMGATLGAVIPIDRGDMAGQGRTFRTEAVEERRRLMAEAQEQRDIEERRLTQLRLAEFRIAQQQQIEKEQRLAQVRQAPVRETLRERLIREAAERGEPLTPAQTLTPQPARRMERKLDIRRPRRPGEDDDSYTA